MIGVYAIVNGNNGHRYIGSSCVSVETRWEHHRYYLNAGRHYNRHLQAAYNKHGRDAFSFSVIEECPPEKSREREQWWLDKLHPEYNLLPVVTPVAGYMPDIVRKRISQSMKCYHRHINIKKLARRSLIAKILRGFALNSEEIA